MSKKELKEKWEEYLKLVEDIYIIARLSKPIFFVPQNWKPPRKEIERMESVLLYEKEAAMVENLDYYFFRRFFGKEEINLGTKKNPDIRQAGAYNLKEMRVKIGLK